MNYKKLGNTDLKVSTICLGTMTWGEQNTEAEAFEQMNFALNEGVNFWDTAELYAVPPKKETYGHTEKIIGNWLKKNGKREDIILATKVAGPSRDYLRKGENSFVGKNLENALNDSLKRLKTDYVDLYQLHWPERITNTFGNRNFQYFNDSWEDNFESILEKLKNLIKKGKIRHIGLSNENPWGIMKFLEYSKRELPKMITIQNPYSLLNRLFEIGSSEICKRESMGLLAYSPLAFGVLTGKYFDGNIPKNRRMDLFPRLKRYNNENSFKAAKLYNEIAKKNDLSLTQVSLAFVNDRPFVTSNIIGATTIEQLKENIDSASVKLSDEIISEINQVNNKIPNPSP